MPAAAQEIEITACVGDASSCFDAVTVDLGIGGPTFDPVVINDKGAAAVLIVPSVLSPF